MANIKAFKTISSDDKNITKLQSNISASLDSIVKSPIIDGVLIKNVLLDSTQVNEISHKLDRIPQGYVITRQRAQADIWDSQDTNTNASKTFLLECSANVYVDIWFF